MAYEQYKAWVDEAKRRLSMFGEPALAVGSSAIAEPVSGLAGLATLPFGGADAAANNVKSIQEYLTYQPRTQAGMQGLQGFQQFVQPFGEIIQGASQNLGDKAYSATGSPELAAAAYSAPTALLEGLGLKGLGIARKPVSGADLYTPRIFAGVKAKTADLDALEKAKALEAAGASRGQIWTETGWMNDGGDWKFEISDKDAQFVGGQLPAMELDGNITGAGYDMLGNALNHERLFEAYPVLKNINIATNPNAGAGVAGSYSDGLLTLRKNAGFDYKRDLDAAQSWVDRQIDPSSPDYWEKIAQESYESGDYPTLDEARSDAKRMLDNDINQLEKVKQSYWSDRDLDTSIHELQHAVQSIEGFSRGGNPESARYFASDAKVMEQSPHSKGRFLYDTATEKYKEAWQKDYIASLEKIVQSESPKPSSVTNQSEFYRYSDEIRDKFGIEPKKPGAARDEWVRSAAAFLRNKAAEEAGFYGNSSDIAKELLENRSVIKKDLLKQGKYQSQFAPDYRNFKSIEDKYKGIMSLPNVEIYKRLGGEVEARKAELRRGFTDQQRKGRAPWLDTDVPENEIIPYKR